MQVKISINNTMGVRRELERIEERFLVAFDVGRFHAMTFAMRLAMPHVPRASGFLRSTAYVTRTGRLGFSAVYAALTHELAGSFSVGGPFFLRRPLSEQRALIGDQWGIATRDAMRQRTSLEGAGAVFPTSPPDGTPPRGASRRSSRRRTRGRTRRAV